MTKIISGHNRKLSSVINAEDDKPKCNYRIKNTHPMESNLVKTEIGGNKKKFYIGITENKWKKIL